MENKPFISQEEEKGGETPATPTEEQGEEKTTEETSK